MIDYSEICSKVVDIATQTGLFIKSNVGNLGKRDVDTKGKNDFVTYVDKEAELKIVTALKALIPQAGYIVEENTSNQKGEKYNWIVDPLDGTTNFIHGLSPYAVSIALQENSEIVIGVVYEISMNECFYTYKSGKSFCNGKEICSSNINKIEDSLLATGFPYNDFAKLDNYLGLLKYCMQNTHGVRRPGSAAIDLVNVACGRVDGFFEYGLKPWDVAAGAYILQNAGGKVADFSGGNDFLFGREIVAAGANLFEPLLQKVKYYMKND